MNTKKFTRNVTVEYDCFSYDKNVDKTIDKCLNCTRTKCTGNCATVRNNSQDERLYLVRAKRTLGDGSIKYGYIQTVTNTNLIQSVSDPKMLVPKTYSGAYYLKSRAEKFIKSNTVLEVVKAKDEIERWDKNE